MPIVIQRAGAAFALVVLGPLIAVLAVAVRVTSHGPAFHRAHRQGPHGEFTIHKLRTMDLDAADRGPWITAAGDARVTPIGLYLRRTKLDELPQLWDVVRGEMALVGPRPEDPRYVNLEDPLHREVLCALPGMTGPAALAYHDEEHILAAAALEAARAEGHERPTEADLDRAYRDVILPAKLAIDAEYLLTRSPRGDLVILGRTIGRVFGRTTRR